MTGVNTFCYPAVQGKIKACADRAAHQLVMAARSSLPLTQG